MFELGRVFVVGRKDFSVAFTLLYVIAKAHFNQPALQSAVRDGQ